MISRRVLLGSVASVLWAGSSYGQSMLGTSSVSPPGPAPAPGTVPPGPQQPKLDDTVGAGLQRIVIVRWGDAINPGAPEFDPADPDVDQAANLFPWDATIAALVRPPPAEDGIQRLVAVFGNPSVDVAMVFPSGVDQPAVSGRLQGATILNLSYRGGRWVTVLGGYQTRRLNDGTLCAIDGPAATDIGSTVQGIIAPSFGAATPWGTVLLGEGRVGPWLRRLASTDFGYGDPSNAPKFGWVAEFDPLNPLSIPTKQTALGRFTHGGIACGQTQDGRAVVFLAEDAPRGRLFRFVSGAPAVPGASPLTAGTLSTATVEGRRLTWKALGSDTASLVGAVAAADAAGAAIFEAPGGLALTHDGRLFVACGGNANKPPGDINGLNPRAGNGNGHVLVLHAPDGDLGAATFSGEIVLLAGEPGVDATAQYAPGSQAWLMNPRTLTITPDGMLWIGTDQGGATSTTADGIFSVPIDGVGYALNIVYLAPIGGAIGGAAFDHATRTAFASVRHPGDTPGSTFAAPATRWPSLRPDMPPQTTVIGLVG